MVQLLADPNFHDDLGFPSLCGYSIREDIAATRKILQHGAEVNQIATGSWEKPLHEAARRNLNTRELLVEHRANLDREEGP
jgi:hypothetical protein